VQVIEHASEFPAYKLIIREINDCRERESAHANHQTLQGEFNDRHNKHKARCESSVMTTFIAP